MRVRAGTWHILQLARFKQFLKLSGSIFATEDSPVQVACLIGALPSAIVVADRVTYSVGAGRRTLFLKRGGAESIVSFLERCAAVCPDRARQRLANFLHASVSEIRFHGHRNVTSTTLKADTALSHVHHVLVLHEGEACRAAPLLSILMARAD